MTNKFSNPAGLAVPNGFSLVARTTGRTTLIVAGQVAYDSTGAIVGMGDLAVQTDQVYRNIQTALAAHGASMNDVVKTTLFVRDLSPDKVGIIRRARAAYISNDQPPASTMVGVSSLSKPELLLEVEATAVID